METPLGASENATDGRLTPFAKLRRGEQLTPDPFDVLRTGSAANTATNASDTPAATVLRSPGRPPLQRIRQEKIDFASENRLQRTPAFAEAWAWQAKNAEIIHFTTTKPVEYFLS